MHLHAAQQDPSANSDLETDFYIDELSRTLERLREQCESLDQAARMVCEASNTSIVGVGKSGYVAQKLASSLRSITIPADFIHAGEALHGDLGRLADHSLAIIVSKSGNSDELKRLLPILGKRRVRIVAITNREASCLGKASEVIINLGVHTEGDHLDMLPLISTDLSLIASNIIVAKVAKRISLTPTTFRTNHPGGQLGFSVGLELSDISAWRMRTPYVTSDTTIFDAAIIMSEHRAGIACVTDANHHLLGILSDGDLRSALADGADLSSSLVRDWMNRSPRVLREDTEVADALTQMESGRRKVFAAPVLDHFGKCLGVVTIHDLVR